METVRVHTLANAVAAGSRLEDIEIDIDPNRSRLIGAMHDQINWAASACSRVLRPLVRLALALGLKYPNLEQQLRDLLLDEARRLLGAKGVARPNISQLAMTTGLNRKDVTARLRTADTTLPALDASPAARVFTLWLQLANVAPVLKRLPTNARPDGFSFEVLARQATRGNVHHRAVLDDLVRLGIAVEGDTYVELAASGFVPAGDLKSLLAFLGDNTRDHLEAAVANVLQASPRMLERAVYADGLTSEEAERLHQLARQRWNVLHNELVEEMAKSVERSGSHGSHRIKIGIYGFHEDVRTPADTTIEEAPAIDHVYKRAG